MLSSAGEADLIESRISSETWHPFDSLILHLKHTQKDQRASTAAKSTNNDCNESSISYSFSLLIGGGGDSELKVESCNGYSKAIREEVTIALAATTVRSTRVSDDFFNLYLSSNPYPLSHRTNILRINTNSQLHPQQYLDFARKHIITGHER